MSATLDTMLSLNSVFADPDLAASTEVLARGGRIRGKTVVFILPLAIIVMIVSYFMRNPGKFRALTDRFSGSTGPGPNGYPNYPPPPPAAQLPPNFGTVPAAPPAPPTPQWTTPPNAAPPMAPFNPPPQQQIPQVNISDPNLFAGARPGMRFNVPPGWPAPMPGWTPPSGWQPDPSWPPAPAGWQFWIPLQQSTTDQPGQRFAAGTTYT